MLSLAWIVVVLVIVLLASGNIYFITQRFSASPKKQEKEMELESKKIDTLRNLATHRISGNRFTGKSALGEALMYGYWLHGSACYDFYSADDDEALTALDPSCPMRRNAILVHANNVRLDCTFETMQIQHFDPTVAQSRELYIMVKSFFLSDFERYAALLHTTRLFQLRARKGWDRVDVLFVREAQEYVSAKTRTNEARTKKEAGEDFVEFHNGMYHAGIALIMDSQREMEVAKNIRQTGTFAYYKSLGAQEIPRELHWLYSETRASLNLQILRRLKPSQFFLKTDQDHYGIGTFTMPPWHISRGTGMLEKYGIGIYDTEGYKIHKMQGREVFNLEQERRPQEPNVGRKKVIPPEIQKEIDRIYDSGVRKATRIWKDLELEGEISIRTIQRYLEERERKQKRAMDEIG